EEGDGPARKIGRVRIQGSAQTGSFMIADGVNRANFDRSARPPLHRNPCLYGAVNILNINYLYNATQLKLVLVRHLTLVLVQHLAVHHLAPQHSEDNSRLFELLRRDGEDVAVDQREVRAFAGRNRADLVQLIENA